MGLRSGARRTLRRDPCRLVRRVKETPWLERIKASTFMFALHGNVSVVLPCRPWESLFFVVNK